MKVTKDLSVTVKDGDLKLHLGRALTSFYYKEQEKFVFRTSEIEPFAKMLLDGKKELDTFYAELKAEPPTQDATQTEK